jgi:chemotaxis regulatin CheY-phosphate phosphatase CheZ
MTNDDIYSNRGAFAAKRLRAMALDIIELTDAFYEQEIELQELREYKRKYAELLDDSIKHSNKVMGGMLDVLLTPGVGEALAGAMIEDPMKQKKG